ncbi:kelch-like protein 18 [Chrysoperla carnea]|uniref:kelch-like protein 18 n=1 Tax=Chrysoperla carnea TaxID=189513 RepID=UPI001D07F452|nr:kelch-like protein 18 [Chrysoperla carnea]
MDTDYKNMVAVEFNDCVIFQETESYSSGFRHMEEIRRQGKLCDVILKVDGHSFSAHKIVLAATIPYFYAMFTHDMIESKMTEITIHSIESIALEALINFAYSGIVVLNKTNVQSIMVGAAFLQLEKVRDACANFLRQRFHPQNVLGFRQFADTLACNNLYDAADKYIEQYFHEVSQSEEYLNLTLKELLSLIKRDALAVDSEEQVFEAIMRWVKHRDGRSEDLPVLLSQVRLPLLTPLYLTDRVATEELIRSSHKCRDLLDEARVYHLLPERRSLLQSFRTRPRSCDTATGQIFVVGGLTKNGDSLCTVESYDPTTGKWQTAQSMSMLRSRLGVAVLHGKLYACGGYNGLERLSTVEVLDPLHKVWSKVSPMHCKRSALGATALGKVIYVCGGYDGITSLNSVEKYCPKTDKWTMVASMNKSRSAGAVVAFQGYVYALGGHDGLSIFNSVERYDPGTDSWTEMKPMLTRRCRLGVAALGGKLYACGGYDGTSFLQTVEVYDPTKDSWSFVSPMNAQRSRVALTANLGKLWAVGGYDGLTNLVSVEVYDPVADTWKYVEPMCAHEGGVGVGVISTTYLS